MGWDDAAWDDLVADLYLAAIDPQANARLPDRFASLIGGTVASLWRLRPRDLAMVGQPATNIPPEAVTAYQTHYYQHDPWGEAVRHARHNAVLHGSEIVDDAALERSAYYNDFGLRYGMFHLLGALVPLGTGMTANVGVISILRPQRANAFDTSAHAVLTRTLPHIAASFQLREHLDLAVSSVQAEALHAALDAFGMPALVLDGHGTILQINALAETVACIRQSVVRRTNPHGILRLPAGLAHDYCAGLVAAASRGQPGGKFRLLDQHQTYVATVTPLPARLASLTGGTHGRVLLLLRPMSTADRSSTASILFRLTVAEAEVAASLAEGLSPAEIAVVRGVKISTIRTLLQRAQDKADCCNLRDLVRVLASLD